MNIRRIILYVVIVALALVLVNAWLKDYPPQQPKNATTTTSVSEHPTAKSGASFKFAPPTYHPQATPAKNRKADAAKTSASKAPSGRLITVKTDVLHIEIDSNGGNLVAAKLPQYPVSVKEKHTPEQILNSEPDLLYLAQSGLTNTARGGEVALTKFSAAQKKYQLQRGQKQLTVKLTGRTANGLSVVKTYTFRRGDYAIKMHYQVTNTFGKKWAGNLFTQMTRRKPPKAHHHFYSSSYVGAAISSPETPYKKITFKSMDETNVNHSNKGGWVAMQQHYFLTAWIPGNPSLTYHYYSRVINPASGGDNTYIIGLFSPQMNVAPGAQAVAGATLYIGPEIAKNLRPLAPGLDHTIDYGWLWPISIIIFWIMHKIFLFVGNWGWAIVITTILIKMLFYPLTAKSFRSMARMREMQPRMQALKERHGDDRQALSKATMELYRKEKINPIGGCLPMVIQIPVFIALYWVLIESVQLRQAPFIFWIHDLSVKDPYYVLPILMGISMLAQQWLSPTSTDPTQQKMMWILPIVFTIFFVNFPAGLVLYWLVNNVVQVLQQWYVNKTFEKHKAKVHARKKKKKKFFKKF